MGADLLLAYVWTTKPESLDWQKGKDAIEAMRPDQLMGIEQFEYNEEVWNDSGIDVDQARLLLHQQLDQIRGLWSGGVQSRTAFRDSLGPVTSLFTGGMSWGDSPTDEFDLFNDFPGEVLEAVGFFA